LGFIKSNALDKAVEKGINEKMASLNWEMNLEEPCLGLNQKNVAMATKGKVSVMVCFLSIPVGLKRNKVSWRAQPSYYMTSSWLVVCQNSFWSIRAFVR
jgi:hypothetical protein